MQIAGLAKKVTIYIGESDKYNHKPLYRAILDLLRAEDCAGATVTRALAGFGAHSRVRSADIVALSTDLPLVIEWIDSPGRVDRVLPRLRDIVVEGLITVQAVQVAAYRHRGLRDLPAQMPVTNIMSRDVHVVGASAPLWRAVEMLLGQRYRTLPVVDEAGQLVGILTDGDILNRAGLLATTVQEALTTTELRQHLSELRRSDTPVSQVMTTPVLTVTPDTSVAEAMQRMVERDVKRLPVVDASLHVIGIVSRVDILRAMAQPPVAELARTPPTPGGGLTVGSVMMTEVPTVRTDATLSEVVDALVSAAQRRVVVVDAGHKVVGIITDGDLIKRASALERPHILQALTHQGAAAPPAASVTLHDRSAGDVMTPQPVCVTPHTSLDQALRLLLEHRIKRLPVVDAQGRLVGLVGRWGILQALSQSLEC